MHLKKMGSYSLLFLSFLAFAWSCSSKTPTASAPVTIYYVPITGTSTNSPTITTTPPNIATSTATGTATSTETPTPTNSPNLSITATPTDTRGHPPSNTPTATITFTPTGSPTPTFTLTPLPSNAWSLLSTLPGGSYFSYPEGVAVGAGFIAVGSGGGGTSGTVAVFNSVGTYLYSISINAYAGMTIDSYGELYVCDYNYNGSGRLEVDGFYLTNSGYNYDYTWSGQGQVEQPEGVKIDANGNLVVADYDTGYVYNLFWNDDSILNQTSGGPSNEALDVALDAKGNIYTSSFVPPYDCSDGGSCGGGGFPIIVEYNNNYSFIYSFSGSNWPTPLGFARSTAVDSTGNLYVSDQNNNKVDYCTAQGTYLGAIGGISEPEYLGLDNGENLFVSENGNSEILEYTQ